MWCQRRTIDVRGSSILSVESIEGLLEERLCPGDHVTAMKYVVIPVEAPEGAEMMSAEGILSQGEYPAHWLRAYHLSNLKESATKGAFLQWLHHTRHAEHILVGLSNGGTYLVDITAGRVPPQEAITITASPVVASEDAAHGEQGVVAMDVAGTIVAAAVHGGASVEVSFFFPQVKCICCIPAPSNTRVSTVRLWEGALSWVELPGEETALYVFVGTEDGAVRLWRVDVMWDQRTPSTAPYSLHSVFEVRRREVRSAAEAGALVAVPGEVRPDAPPTTNTIKCLEINGAEDDCHGRLVAGTTNSLAAWDLSGVPFISPALVKATDIAARVVSRLQGINSTGTAVTSVTKPEEFLVGSATVNKMLDRLGETRSRAVEGCVGSSPLTGLRVYVPYARVVVEEACRLLPEATPVKPKHGLVCEGAEVGVVVDVSIVASPSSSEGADMEIMCGVLFPSLKKNVVWPLRCLDVVVPSLLVTTKADSMGPVYSVASLSNTRIATGGADGSVKVWEFTGGLYTVVQCAKRHSDLVKQVVAVRRPDIFLSSSYDGTVREWHMYDVPNPLLNCQNTTLVSTKTSTSGESQDVQPVGIIDFFPAFNALFAVPLFHSSVNTYTLMATLGCEPPPNMIYDGERTRLLALPASDETMHVEREPAEEAISEALSHVSS